MRISDCSSDVCSSYLVLAGVRLVVEEAPVGLRGDLVRELREAGERDPLDLPRAGVDGGGDARVGLPGAQVLAEDARVALGAFPEAGVRLQVDEQAARARAQAVGRHLRLALRVDPLDQGPGV